MKLDSLISRIQEDKMNSICFDCGAEHPVFVSINNGIFLCDQCATVHMSFPQGISIIENNDLYALPESGLKHLALGGNTRLNDFILDEYPKLENYSQKLLYKTRAMDYYRKRLNYLVNGGPEPRRPSQVVACQLIPDNYNQNSYIRKIKPKYEPKTRTYRPEEQIKSRKFNINPRNNEFDDEEELFRDPFMNESKFGMNNEGNMFKKFFGDDFFGLDDDFFGFGKNKLNQTHNFDRPQYNTEKPNVIYSSNLEPKDNKKSQNQPYYHKVPQQRPLTAKNPIFVPSRKHKYIKKEDQNNNYNNNNFKITNNFQNMNNYNNNNSNNNYNNRNYNNYTNNTNYSNNNNYTNNNTQIPKVNKADNKYNPFKRRDSTDLITLPGNENNNLLNNKRKQKTNEIPLEFHNRASGLGQITDAIKEKNNEEESISEKSEENEENELDSSAELEKIAKNNTHTINPKDIYDENQITIKNSISNKYKKRKSEKILENFKNEEKLRNEKNNIHRKPSIKGTEFDKKFVRRLSKMNITNTHWNINQLGDINTYPDAMEVEG